MPREERASGVPARQVPMRLIVHGLHRTGSLSMRTALHQLGFHHCYHMATVIENVEHDANLWAAAMKQKYEGKELDWTREDWDEILGDSQACVDLPSALFTLELSKAYPEAKIILLNRDPEKWYESVLGSVYQAMKPPTFLDILQNIYCSIMVKDHRHWVDFCVALVKYGLPYDHGTEKEKAIDWFKKSYQDVRNAIPADKRLEFSVKDGFGPLCEYLGTPVPMVKDKKTGEMIQAPFPHVNDRASFLTRASDTRSKKVHMANERLFTVVSRAVTLGLMCYGGYAVWKTRIGGQL